MFCAASVAPPAVADGDLPMLAFLSFPVSSLLMCAAAIRRTGFFVFHGIPNPAFSALPTLCFHHFLIFFDFSTSAVLPRRVPCRQVEPATQGTSPPAGRMVRPSFPVPPGFSPRGCKGRSPLHEITLGSPFPGGEERSASAGGGMGAKKQTKVRGGERQERQAPPVDSGMARSAGDQPGKPPPGAPTAGRAGNGAAHLPTTVIISYGKCDIFPKIC